MREIRDDEKFVLVEFENHAASCTQCTLALDERKDDLCGDGRLRAIDVTQYLYSKDRKLFSVVDKESGQPMMIKLPAEINIVLALLEAVEAGMELKTARRGRASPVRPSDNSARRPLIKYVRPRSSSPGEESEPEPTCIIERSPTGSKSRTILYHSPRTSPSRSPSSRGSVYSNDRHSWVERRYGSTTVYRKSGYYT